MMNKSLLIFSFLFSFYLANSQSYVEKRLTNDSYEDLYLCVSGNKVVWFQDSLTFRNLMFWDGTKKIKLVNGKSLKASKCYPKISGNYIAWAESDGHDFEIMLYDGVSISQITNNDYEDLRPDLSGNKIVWQAYQSGKNNVYYYDGQSTVKLNADSIEGYLPRISGDKIAWYGQNSNGTGIFTYENNQSKLISYFDLNTKSEPLVSDNIISWVFSFGDDNAISFYNTSTHNLAKLFPSIRIVDIYDNYILYQAEDLNKNKNVYLYTGAAHKQLTTNGVSYASSLHGDSVLYESSGKVYLYRISSDLTTEITQDGNDGEPQSCGETIVWLREINNQNEVYILTPDNSNSVGDLENKHIKVFPNPSSDQIHVEGINGKVYSLSLISLDGKVLKNISNCNSINISDLSKGVYVLTLTIEGEVIRELVVKN